MVTAFLLLSIQTSTFPESPHYIVMNITDILCPNHEDPFWSHDQTWRFPSIPLPYINKKLSFFFFSYSETIACTLMKLSSLYPQRTWPHMTQVNPSEYTVLLATYIDLT